ncbi:MAG: hypothetical protein R3F30_03360 [Planctomycetota bacterium]
MKSVPALCSLFLASCLVAGTAHADKVWFKAASDGAEGNAAAFLEGKVLEENDTTIRLRVEGGEMTVQRSQVAKVEKDDLAVADIEQREAAAQEALADAEANRQAMVGRWAEAAVTRREEARRERPETEVVRIVVDFQGMFGNKVFRAYDPILKKMDFHHLADIVDRFLHSEVLRLTGRKYL